jgi:hypothetical protein
MARFNLWQMVDDKYPFDILLSGDVPPNPPYYYCQSRFSFVDELKKRYDIIFFDGSYFISPRIR